MKIGDKIEYVTTVHRGKTATITRREGTVLELRTARQALVKPAHSKRSEWVDVEVTPE